MSLIKINIFLCLMLPIIFLSSSCASHKFTTSDLLGTWEAEIIDNNDNYSKINYLVSYNKDGTAISIAQGFVKSNKNSGEFATYTIIEKYIWNAEEDYFTAKIEKTNLVNVFGDEFLSNRIREYFSDMREEAPKIKFTIKATDKNTITSVCEDGMGNIFEYKFKKISISH